ncbi:MAG: beta-galactosidase [Ruminococcaceae bacterium]|nr:beta-galactosidase [Oscillospiraceae bacterium]
MNFRQIHLDFHTSECIEGIGSRFSKKQFQDALKRGHVNSITVFSKCHHGWAYHPSEANEMHPHLNFDLLAAQIEAAHEIGVKTPVYLSAGLDEKMAYQHPEWLLRQKGQPTLWKANFTAPGYHLFCMNTPYLDYLLDQIREVVRNYDADGIFLDIVGERMCSCSNCCRDIAARGGNPESDADIRKQAEITYANYTRRVREAIDEIKPGLPLFHNSGHVRRGRRDLAYVDTHLELESLPTGGWGYDHFPMSAAYSRTLGMQFLGMTGKFHTSWGEFGGFKHPNALRYEAALSAAFGAKCSIGDQLHPLGEMDMATYDLVGKAYAELETKEPWLDDVTPVVDIAVLSQEAVDNYYGQPPANRDASLGDVGATRVMLEGKYLFNVIDTEAPLDGYKLVILPDSIRLDAALQEKLAAFIAAGGKILASGTSALKKDADEFAFDLGAEYVGASEYRPIYYRPCFRMDELQNAAFVIGAPAQDIKATGSVLVERENPYFNRTVEHFCSHRHAPNNPSERFPAVTVGKDGAYISAAIFEEYASMGNLIAKKVAVAAIDALIGESKTVKTDLPAQGVVTLMDQTAENRLVCHQLYATPIKRGKGVEIIEDIQPLYNITSEVRVGKEPKRVYLAPQMSDVPYTWENGVLHFTLDKLEIHAMVVIEY